MTRPIVIKIGGNANVDATPLLDELARTELGPVVLVHGHSHEATRVGEALGVPPRFVRSPSGHRSRLTDEATLDAVHLGSMRVNDRLVQGLRARGVPAVGVRAGDAGLLAEHKGALRAVTDDGRVQLIRGDRSGRATGMDPTTLRALLDSGVLPVVSPLGRTKAGELASLDGDRCAAALAGALDARAVVLLTAVQGVLRDVDDPTTLVTHLDLSETDHRAPFIKGAMKRKVLATSEALEAGVPRALIASAAGMNDVDLGPVAAALQGHGTEVHR